MTIVGWIIEGVLFAFIGFLWVRLITDWVQVFARGWEPRGVLLVFLELSYSVTDPPIKGLRKVIKPIRIGNFALDISFFLVMILAYILLAVNRSTLLY
ncbi:YggT family protein [Pimelobacter simplex]|uniref:YggT family protein n=1 Tax=Nocardioides simplex TaxID=2045 RepID=A0A4Y3N1B2_NOCSI|nr:YggT family protein [Pimelobacter simplex]KAB2807585.1 YggT family protein [Pimelobacter simplex]MCG8151601.1 YggT family protein [Pimelobacter simplex]GEB13216.1 YggT family protein [Pimelobacter simplex]SFM47989.1 YggT family protein [Pimelobacter simplex]